MQDVLEFILKNITTVPADVKVEEKTDEEGTNYIISVNPADVGRIIGKEGKVIKAIRTIMRVIAIQKGVRVRVSVLSDDAPAAAPQDEVTIEATPEPETAVEPVAEAPMKTAETVAVENPDEITVEV